MVLVSSLRRHTVGMLVVLPLLTSCGTPWFISRPAPPAAMTRTTPVPPSLEFFHSTPTAVTDSAALRTHDDSAKRPSTGAPRAG